MKTILCIPGNWKDRSEIVTSIAKNNLNEFLFAGMVLLNLKTSKGYEMEISDADSRMKDSFRWAGMANQVTEEFLEEIARHTFVVYMIGETGDLQSARAIAEAGNALLKAGGTGIKVESTGKAFTREHWSSLINNFEIANLYEMFVLDTLYDEAGNTYSCGMHNLGFKDSIVLEEDFNDAVRLISTFGYYQILENPEIHGGQTFSIAQDAPIYQIVDEIKQPYLGDELFENPYGMWRLKRK